MWRVGNDSGTTDCRLKTEGFQGQTMHGQPKRQTIEIGEGLTAFALSHHLAYGTVPGGSYSRDTRFVMIEEEKQTLLSKETV